MLKTGSHQQATQRKANEVYLIIFCDSLLDVSDHLFRYLLSQFLNRPVHLSCYGFYNQNVGWGVAFFQIILAFLKVKTVALISMYKNCQSLDRQQPFNEDLGCRSFVVLDQKIGYSLQIAWAKNDLTGEILTCSISELTSYNLVGCRLETHKLFLPRLLVIFLCLLYQTFEFFLRLME